MFDWIGSGLSTAIPFIVMIGLLVFFHELGHFLAARLFGVGVTTFQLGFGPKIWSRKRGETEYRISWVPLGGLVKMIGEDPDEEVEPEREAVSFSHKPVWQRAIVVFAGPAFNFVLAFFIFIPVFLVGYPRLQAIVGSVDPGSPAAEAGLAIGDRVVAVDGERIDRWDDMRDAIEGSGGRPVTLTVLRDGEEVRTTAQPRELPSTNLFGKIEPAWGLGIHTAIDLPYFGVSDPSSPAAQAGIRTGDQVFAVDGEPIDFRYELENRLAARAGQTLPLTVLRPVEGDEEGATEKVEVNLAVPDVHPFPGIEALGLEDPGLFLVHVVKDGPADQAGMRAGDKILRADGEPVTERNQFLDYVRERAEIESPITVLRDGKEVRVVVVPALKRRETDRGTAVRQGRIDVYIGGATASGVPEPERHYNPLALVAAAGGETWFWTKATVQAFYYIFSGQISVQTIGGPVRIAQMAGKSARAGLMQYILLMAILSVNLAVLNLFPMPILDGGHLVLFGIEAIRRRPLEMRTVQIASYVGLALLLALMVLVFYNDIAFLFPQLRGTG